MRELTVTDVDGATLIAKDDEGNEFRIPVDEISLRRLRHTRANEEAPVSPPKTSKLTCALVFPMKKLLH